MADSDFITEGQVKAAGPGWNRAPAFIAAKGMGTSGDRNIILDAQANRRMLQAGTYFWSGAPMDVDSPWLIGNRGPTSITIPDGSYLFDCNRLGGQLTIRGIEFGGGAGVYRNRYTGVNVAGHHMITECRFMNQTVCAISHNSSDMPFWEIQHNTFHMASPTGTMAVALSGLTDGLLFENNNFEIAQIGLKLGSHAANARITGNDFIRFQGDPLVSRADLWLVPKDTNVDAGIGINISSNKFGNENLNDGDYRILFADETGTGWNAERFPSTAPSTGFVTGLRIRDNVFNNRAEGDAPPVTSRTPNVLGTEITSNHIAGDRPETVLKFEGIIPSGLMKTLVGPITVTDTSWEPIPATVPVAPVQVHDTNGLLFGSQEVDLPFPPPPLLVVNPMGLVGIQASPDRTTLPKGRNDGDFTEFVSLTPADPWTGCFSGGKFIQDTAWGGNPMVRLAQNIDGLGDNQLGFRVITNSSWIVLEGQAGGDNDLAVTVKVNGQMVSTKPIILSGVSQVGAMAGIYLNLGNTSEKLVEVFQKWPLARLIVESGATWRAPGDTRAKLYVMGDSWVEGHPQAGPWRSFTNVMQALTPWEVASGGRWGTGYEKGGGDPWTYPWSNTTKLQAATSFVPDIMIFAGTYEDRSGSASAVLAAIKTALNYVEANSPTTKIILIGPQFSGGESGKNMASLRAEGDARASVIGVFDPVAGLWVRENVKGKSGTIFGETDQLTPLGAEWWATCVTGAVRQSAVSAGLSKF